MDSLEMSASKEKKQVRIKVPETIQETAQDTLKELRKRGAEVTLEELFEDLFLQIDPGYWEKQLEKRTPDSHLLDLAKENPEIRQFLVVQARKAFEAISRGESILKIRKKPGRKPKSPDLGV